MRGSSQFLVGGFVLLAVGLSLYIAFVLLQAAGDLGPLILGPFILGPSGVFVLVAMLFFAHAWSMRKSEQMVSSGALLPPLIR